MQAFIKTVKGGVDEYLYIRLSKAKEKAFNFLALDGSFNALHTDAAYCLVIFFLCHLVLLFSVTKEE